VGRIAQIIGRVLDVTFPPGNMPNIFNSLIVKGQEIDRRVCADLAENRSLSEAWSKIPEKLATSGTHK